MYNKSVRGTGHGALHFTPAVAPRVRGRPLLPPRALSPNLLSSIPSYFGEQSGPSSWLNSPPISQAFSAPFLSPDSATDRRLICKQGRETVLCPSGRFPRSPGAPGSDAVHYGIRGRWEPHADSPLFSPPEFPSPRCSFTPSLLKRVPDTEGEAVMEVSQAKGWGSSRQFQFDANDLCTIQGQRMICEACAPTHARTQFST